MIQNKSIPNINIKSDKLHTNLAKSIILNGDKNANLSYSKIGFLLPLLIDEIDKLKETSKPMRQLKYHMNELLKECEKESKKHYQLVSEMMNFTDENGFHHKGEDVYFNTESAYRSLFERPTQDIIGIAELIKTAEEKGIEFQKIEVVYDPLK